MTDYLNNSAWIQLFEKHKIIEHINKEGIFTINSKEINEVREARLMTKFDHSFQLPQTFVDSGLSILPISRGKYIISKIKTFHTFHNEEDTRIVEINAPTYLESLDYYNITSEATAINVAYVSGIIETFTGDTNLLPTVNGRMSSQSFDFKISTNNDHQLNISVENSQIEIDGGYEGNNSLALIEAKLNLSSDFIIRQLYYPYRLWESKISKAVRPIFLTYTNGIFHLREYRFTELESYNSIYLVKEEKYRIREDSSITINTETITDLLQTTTTIDEPEVPFPQADSFERIINLCEILNNIPEKSIGKIGLSINYDFKGSDYFDMRQVDYYTNAARYLGFIEKKGSMYILTDNGNQLFNLHIKERQVKFIKTIIEHAVFKKALELYFSKAELPTRDEIIHLMKDSNIYRVNSDSTFTRRASTITSWLNWIIGTIEE